MKACEPASRLLFFWRDLCWHLLLVCLFSWHRATETAGFARAAVGLIEGLFAWNSVLGHHTVIFVLRSPDEWYW